MQHHNTNSGCNYWLVMLLHCGRDGDLYSHGLHCISCDDTTTITRYYMHFTRWEGRSSHLWKKSKVKTNCRIWSVFTLLKFHLQFINSVCILCGKFDDIDNFHATGAFHATKPKSNVDHVTKLTNQWKNMTDILGDWLKSQLI